MTPTRAEPDTLADVLHALGDIPPHRVLWHPFPGTATEEDQLRCVDGEPKRLVELVDGVLVEKAVGARESLFSASLIGLIAPFVRQRRLGVMSAPDGVMQLRPGLNRLPDVSFTPWDHLPTHDAHVQPVARFAPDLAVEILSEGNTRREMARKRREYFAAGTRLVWVIDPDARTVAAYTDPDAHTVYTADDTIPGDPVLPGFALPLTDLFDDPQLNPRPA